jgi:hypothetical protein
MAIIEINDNPSPRELRHFAAIWFPLFSFAVATFLYVVATFPTGAVAAAVLGVVIAFVGYRRPRFIHPIYLIWMYAAYPIGFVVSHLLLGVIFYGVFTTIGFLMRLFAYDPLQRRLRTEESSYWTPIQSVTNKAEYFRQF